MGSIPGTGSINLNSIEKNPAIMTVGYSKYMCSFLILFFVGTEIFHRHWENIIGDQVKVVRT